MMWAFVMVGTALATGVTHEEVNCPYGEGKVRRYHKVSSNNLGGYDSDLARYSTRAQFREFAVSTCPSNYFSMLGKDLDLVIPPEKAPAIDQAIAESRGTWTNPDEPEVWERYDTAARISAALGRDPLAVADLYLQASWTARDHAVGIYVGGLNGPEAAKKILDIGAKELKKDLTPEATKLLRYNLARVAHRGGFVSERDAHLEAFLTLPNLTPEERQAGLRMQHIATVIEPALQARAISALKAALASGGDSQRLLQARYQLADLQRRIGQNAAAKRDFHLVAQSGSASDDVRALAEFLLDTLGG